MGKSTLELARACAWMATRLRGLSYDLSQWQEGTLSSSDILDLLELGQVLSRLHKYLIFGPPTLPPDPHYEDPDQSGDDIAAGTPF